MLNNKSIPERLCNAEHVRGRVYIHGKGEVSVAIVATKIGNRYNIHVHLNQPYRIESLFFNIYNQYRHRYNESIVITYNYNILLALQYFGTGTQLDGLPPNPQHYRPTALGYSCNSI